MVCESQSLPQFWLIPGGLFSDPYSPVVSASPCIDLDVDFTDFVTLYKASTHTRDKFINWVDLTDNLGSTGKGHIPEHPAFSLCPSNQIVLKL